MGQKGARAFTGRLGECKRLRVVSAWSVSWRLGQKPTGKSRWKTRGRENNGHMQVVKRFGDGHAHNIGEGSAYWAHR
eukprot:1706781-Pleurochrysis_carterae.AAC.1